MNLRLAPLDYYFARPNLFAIQFVFHYGYSLEATRLQCAFEAVADRFVPLRMVLRERGDQWEFVPGPIPSLERLDAARPVLGLKTILGEPLFRLGLSAVEGGSVLSLSMSHALGDGHSYFMVLNALAQAYQGREFPSP